MNETLNNTENPPCFIHGVMGSNYCSVGAVRDFQVLLCDRKEIVGFVEYWHYSKNVNGLTTDYCFKLLDADGNMIGAMIYGKIAMANVWKKYAEKETDLIEVNLFLKKSNGKYLNGKSTTDFIDYAILISNSKNQIPIEEMK